jgi:outer membrane protein
MLKKVSLALVLASLVSTTALADGSHTATSSSGGEDHLVLKARAGWLGSSTKIKDAGPLTATVENGYVGELALGYFFTDNIAVEGSVGYGRTKIKSSGLTESKTIGIVPVSALVQYHFIPEAVVSPYVGVGYSYQFITGSPSEVKVKNGGGFVGQVGLDVPYNDTMGFNIDAKYTYKAGHDLQTSSVTYKNTVSTTAVTAGVTFSF